MPHVLLDFSVFILVYLRKENNYQNVTDRRHNVRAFS